MFKLLNKKNNNKNTTESKKAAANAVALETQKKKTVQDWIPVYDVSNGAMHRRDGYLVVALEVEPINIDLLSKTEKKRIIASLHEVVNGQQEYVSWCTMPRPVDLDGYIAGLEENMRAQSNMLRRRLLQGYIKQAVGMASSGEAIERKFYYIITQEEKEHAKEEIDNRAKELQSNLFGADLKSTICKDKELINTLFLFTHPAQAAYERAPIAGGYYIPTQYKED